MSYFGIFKQLNELNLPISGSSDIYEGYFAESYEASTGPDRYDVGMYLEQAALKQSPILELACGSGRITIELAKAGYSVTGIDLSQDMMNLLEKKLRRQSPKVKQRITLHLGDITEMKLDQKFNLVIFPATTLCLVPEEARVSLFQSVYDLLEEGGRFVFDYHVREQDESVKVYTREPKLFTQTTNTGQKQFVLIGEQRDLNKMKATANFYAEIVDEEITHRFLGHTVKQIFTDEMIQSYIDATQFRVAEIKEIHHSDIDNIKFVILEK